MRKSKVTSVLIACAISLSGSVASAKSARGLQPQAALQELKDGNARFVAGKAAHCSTDRQSRADLQEGQAPIAVVLGCSDSRVPPEFVFDQALGRLFTIRVAGNVLDSDVIASIEYAISHLGPRLIVVLGHESCGAVMAALKTPPGQDAGSPSLDVLVTEIRKNLGAEAMSSRQATDKEIRGPVRKNVSSVTAELLERSRMVKAAVDSGQVKVVQSVYSLATGKADFFP